MRSVIWRDLLIDPVPRVQEEKPEPNPQDEVWDGVWIGTISICVGLVLFAIAMIHR